MNHLVAMKLIVSGAVCSRCCMCMKAFFNCLRDALRSDGSAALSASSVGVNSLEIAWRLMSAMRALTKACWTAPLLVPDVHGVARLPLGGGDCGAVIGKCAGLSTGRTLTRWRAQACRRNQNLESPPVR